MEYLKTYEELIFNNNKIKMSLKLVNVLKKIAYNKYSELFLSLPTINSEFLINNHPNYLDFDSEGNISYLDFKYIENENEDEKYFLDSRRQKIKATRILFKIIKPEYINIAQPEIEKFSNNWKVAFVSDIDVIELKGEDILRAYNFTNEVKNDGGSCAIHPKCGSKDRFNVLVNNDNFSAFVAIDNSGIIGRTLSIGGIQTETFGIFKKGKYYKILNNFYGKGGNGSSTDLAIREYAKNSGCGFYNTYGFKKIENGENLSNLDIFRIKIENTYQKESYPAIDNLYIHFDKKEVSNRPGNENGWIGMYGAHPRKSRIYD